MSIIETGPAVTALSPGGATAVALSASGEVFVLGFEGQPRCCEAALLRALSPDGAAVTSFERNGQADPVPYGSSSGGMLALLPSGALVAVGEYRSTGCGGDGLAEYASGRQPVRGFRSGIPPVLPPGPDVSAQLVAEPTGGFDLVEFPCGHMSHVDHIAGGSRGRSGRHLLW